MSRTRITVIFAALLLAAVPPARGQLDPNAFTSLGTLNHPSGALSINTDTLTVTGAVTFTGVALNQIGGPQIAVFDFDSLTIGSAATVTISGSRPLALLTRGNATIQSVLTVSTQTGGALPALGGYAGGNVSAATSGGNSQSLTQNGGGPGGGGTNANAVAAGFAGGGGYGGYGGSSGIDLGGTGGLAYGNLYQNLQGGSGGGAVAAGDNGDTAFALGGFGGGALEVVAAGTLTVANVTANGRNGGGDLSGNNNPPLYQAGGGAGGGILLSSGTGLTLNGFLDAQGGDGSGTGGHGDAGGGGGGRIALTGQSSYTIGTSPSFINLNGGNVSGSGEPALAGIITMDALSTTIPSGTSVTLNGTPVISVAGSTTQTGLAIEAYIRRDLVVSSGATATLGMNNALQHLDANGNNVTSLTVNGTFNLNGFSQTVDTLSGSGSTGIVNLPAGSTLTVGVNGAFSTFTGQLNGSGSFVKAGAGTQIVGPSPSFTGQATVTGGLLAIGDQALPNSTVVLAGGGLGLGFDTNPVLGALAGTVNVNLGGTNFNSLTVGGDNASTTYSGSFSGSPPGGLIKAGTGTWTLTGTNTQTGPFNVQAGTVLIGSPEALAPSNFVSVSAGATLDLNGYNYAVTAGNQLAVQGTLRLGGAAVTVASGATATYNGGMVSNGFLGGPGTHIVTGGATLRGVTTFNSTVVNVTGAGSFVDFANGGLFNVSAGAATPVSLSEFTNQGSGSITLGAVSAATAADFQSYGTLTLTPAVVGSNQQTLMTNAGTSAMFFNGGSRTFIGTPQTATSGGQPTFVAGMDLEGKNLVIAGGLFVNNGFVSDFGSGTKGSVIVDYGALYKGAGFSGVNVVTQNGGRVQAGNSPGASTFASLTIGPGALNAFNWEINDAGQSTSFPSAPGVGGPQPNASNQVSGWSQEQAIIISQGPGQPPTTGNLTWTASSTAGNQFQLALFTLMNPSTVGQENFGPMADFDPLHRYMWPFLTYQGTYTGPTDSATLTADTLFDTSQFLNSGVFAGDFGLELVQNPGGGGSIDIVYPVPEPGSLALVGLVAVAFMWRQRAKRPVMVRSDSGIA